MALSFYLFLLFKTRAQTGLSTLYFFNTSFCLGAIQKYASLEKDSAAVQVGIVTHVVFQLHISFIDCTFLKNYATNTGA